MKPNSRRSKRLLLSAALLVPLALGANQPDSAAGQTSNQKWTKVTDGTIDFYTRESPQNAAALLSAFDNLNAFFKQAGPFPVFAQPHLTVVAFNSAQEFAQYRLNAGSCAFYQQTERGEYVVLQDLSAEHRTVSAHEFTHFVVTHSGLKLPLWLNEGIADVYSTLSVSDNQTVVGASVPGRLKILHHHAWLTLPSLFSVGITSGYYSEPSKMELFYSQSWALTHMLALSSGYSTHFPGFLRSISEGRSPEESIQLNFHKSLPQVEADLREYVDQSHLPVVTAALKLAPAPVTSLPVMAASNSDVDLALSGLILSNPASKADIQARLAATANRLPNDARAEESLGFMAMRQGKIPEARVHFDKAIERHSADASVYFYAAHFAREASVPDEQLLPLLRHALELKPDYYEAHLELALVATSTRDYALALQTLTGLQNPRPEHAYAITYSMAYCYAQTDKLTQARQYIAKAKPLASSENDRADLTRLSAFVDEQQEYVADAQPTHP